MLLTSENLLKDGEQNTKQVSKTIAARKPNIYFMLKQMNKKNLRTGTK